jgi:hypothetical protein
MHRLEKVNKSIMLFIPAVMTNRLGDYFLRLKI